LWELWDDDAVAVGHFGVETVHFDVVWGRVVESSSDEAGDGSVGFDGGENAAGGREGVAAVDD
jgi:hypothetical protein